MLNWPSKQKPQFNRIPRSVIVVRYLQESLTMMPRLSSCFPNVSQALQMFPAVSEDQDQLLSASSSVPAAYAASDDHSQYSTSLLYSLSILKDKMNQVQSLVNILVSSYQTQQDQSTSLPMTNMNSLIQEIIVAASSMMLTCQHMAILGSSSVATTTEEFNQPLHHVKLSSDNRLSRTNLNSLVGEASGKDSGHGFFCRETLDWFDENYPISNVKDDERNIVVNETKNFSRIGRRELSHPPVDDESEEPNGISSKDCDIIELDAGDLLAKYTHYCQVCGKGFKRDANLRMHMRAHGDKYKTNAALSNPMKHSNGFGGKEDYLTTVPKKYSCPQEGCRWNKNHAKFQPLKSIICVKNHYKRSHCPKMYVCKRCNQKQFSVLSDLRTHEKHCGDQKWQCSCGTTFSRKDKLMGHCALFVGHTPVSASSSSGKIEQ